MSAEVVPVPGTSTGDVLVLPGGSTEGGAAYLDCIGGCFRRFTVDGPTTAVRAAGTLLNATTGNKVVVPAE